MLASPETTFKFVAVDPDVQDDFATNVNVVVSPVPEGVTFELYRDASRAEVEAITKGSRIDEQVVLLRAGQAFRFSYDSEFRSEGETRTLATLQYGFLRQARSYVITFTTLPELREEYANVFDRSARSFRFL